jgi:TIR domain
MRMPEQSHLRLRVEGERGKDLFLRHRGADRPWVERLAERFEAETRRNRLLEVVFDKWDFAKGSNIVLDIEKEIHARCYIGVIMTCAPLNATWPTPERSIAVWSEPPGTRGRVIPLLGENVTLPAPLRIRNWIARSGACHD